MDEWLEQRRNDDLFAAFVLGAVSGTTLAAIIAAILHKLTATLCADGHLATITIAVEPAPQAGRAGGGEG